MSRSFCVSKEGGDMYVCFKGWTWLYGDVEELTNWNVGDRIKKGELISQEGNPSGTGSTGNHVHLELEMLTKGESFKYGFDNSENPCPILGIENVVNQTSALRFLI